MNEELEIYFLRQAIALGRSGMQAGLGGPFGALIVRDSLIIGQGVNRVTSGKDPTAHAEIVAIRDACRRLDDHQLAGCVLYTSCEPCPMCLGAIYWARPERVVFAAGREHAAAAGFDDAFIYQELHLPLAGRAITMVQQLAGEGAQLFREWVDKPDKISY